MKTKVYAVLGLAMLATTAHSKTFQFGNMMIDESTCQDIVFKGGNLCKDLEFQKWTLKTIPFFHKFGLSAQGKDPAILSEFIKANPDIIGMLDEGIEKKMSQGKYSLKSIYEMKSGGGKVGKLTRYLQGANPDGANFWLSAVAVSGADYSSYPTVTKILDGRQQREETAIAEKQRDDENRALRRAQHRASLEENAGMVDQLLKNHKYVAKLSQGPLYAGCYYVSKIRLNNRVQNCDTQATSHAHHIGLNSGFNLEVKFNPNLTKTGTMGHNAMIEIFDQNKNVVYSDTTDNAFSSFKVKE